MKKLKYLFLIMVTTFMSVTYVNAEVNNNNYIVKMINRDGSQFPFTTWYTAGENVTYPDSNYVEFSFNEVGSKENLPRYLYTIYCGTGSLQLNTTSGTNSKGSITYNGNTGGGSCQVNYGGNTYNGTYYLVRWLLDYSYYNNNFGVDVYGVRWSINLHNTYNYPVYVRFETIFVSNEMINDFSSDYLLRQILNQNAELRNELNTIKSSTNETNNKLDKTNEELGEVNDNITNDDVGGVENSFDSFEGFVSENSTITQLITMPITLYSSILNGLQSTCQPFVLGNLLGTNLTIPCINIGNYLGSTLWAMIDVIISGFAIFSISKKLIKIFNNFSSMKEGDVIDD